jgi:lipid II:glycine glycyltransferase (peptidoglycan interpeptide bridge formation enzyme)
MAIEVKQFTARQRDKWDAFVSQEPTFALLQSWAWGEFKEKLGWRAYRVAVEAQSQILAGAQLLIKPFPMGLGSIAYVPRGPIGPWLEDEVTSLLLSELNRIARHHRAVFLRLEPPLMNKTKVDEILQQYHFQPSYHTNQPKATIILDLSAGLDDIYAQFRKSTRKDIEKSTGKGLTSRVGGFDDMPAFYELMDTTARRKHFPSRGRKYYKLEWQTFADIGKSALHLVSYQDQVLAAGMVCYFGTHAAQFHAGSIGKLTNLHPNHVLVWERIKWAKIKGCRTYDLWGIPDEISEMTSEGKELPVSDRTDGLWGVYRFKSGFSKNIVAYVGAYDCIYAALPYAFVTSKLLNRDLLEQLAAWADTLKPRR